MWNTFPQYLATYNGINTVKVSCPLSSLPLLSHLLNHPTPGGIVRYLTAREATLILSCHPRHLSLKVVWFVDGDVPQDLRISCNANAYSDRRFSASFNYFIQDIKPWKRAPI